MNVSNNRYEVEPLQSTGKVHYIEPNYTNSLLGNDGNPIEFVNDYEDYCIAVDLQVEIKGRTIGGKTNGASTVMILSWENKQNGGSVSFLQGSRIHFNKDDQTKGYVNSLTTDYADMYYDDIRNGKETNEMFGISSIDISYNNYCMPQVTIQFVDIRGISLLAPEELRHSNSYDNIGGFSKEDVAGSFFKCFFTFPYPKFYLKVKGFYGEPVSYELTCSDFRCSFDPSTGNFGATAQFIGYSFSLLNDVTLNALVSAPLSDYLGKSYWESKLNSSFTVTNEHGTSVPMPTLTELMGYLKTAKANMEIIGNNDPLKAEQDTVDKQLSYINALSTSYARYVDKLYSSLNEIANEVTIKGSKRRLLFRENDNKGLLFLHNNSKFKEGGKNINVHSEFSDLQSSLDRYNSVGKGLEGFTFTEFSTNDIFQLLKLDNSVLVRDSSLEKTNYKDLYNKVIDGTQLGNILTSLLSDNNSIDISSGNSRPLNDYVYAYVYSDNGFVDKLTSIKNHLTTKNSELQAQIAQKQIEAMSNSIGFMPSVKNVMKILMAHLETLLHIINQAAISADGQERTLSSMGIEESDFNENIGNVPPFPKVAMKKTEHGVTTMTDKWIGDLPIATPEADAVHGLLNGSAVAKPVYSDYAQAVSQVSNGGTSVSCYVPIPLSWVDMILTSCPFGINLDFSDISDFVGRMMFRMFLTCYENSILFNDSKNSRFYELFGKADAINFAKFFPSPSKKFVERLNSNLFNADYMLKIAINDKSDEIQNNKKDGALAWQNSKYANQKEGIISTSNNGKFSLNLYRSKEDNVVLPIQGYSFKTLNDELILDENGLYKIPSNLSKFVTNSDAIDENTFIETNTNIIIIDENVEKYKSYIRQIYIDDSTDTSIIQNKFLSEKDKQEDYNQSFNCIGETFVYANEGENINLVSAKDNRLLNPTKRSHDVIKSDFENGINVFGKPSNSSSYNFKTCKVPSDINNIENTKEYKREVGSNVHNEFINNPNGVSNYTITSFYGLYSDVIYDKFSLFSQNGYYVQTDNRVRAWFFLVSIYNKKTIDFEYNKLWSKLDVLINGAYYWLDKYSDETTRKNIIFLGFKNEYERNEIKNAFISYFINWVDTEFAEIQNEYELKVNGSVATPDFIRWFGKNLDENWNDGADNKRFLETIDFFDSNSKIGDKYVNFEDYITTIFSDNFFKNYVSLSRTPNSEGNKAYGFKLYNRENTYISNKIMQLYVTKVVVTETIKNYTDISIEESYAKLYLNSFITELRKQYEGITNKSSSTTQQAAVTQCDEHIKISLYKYLKTIYDRWFGAFNFDDWTIEGFFNNNFYFIDSFYNRIGDEIIINLQKLMDKMLYAANQEDYTLLSLIGDVLAENNFMFLCVQNFLDMSNRDKFRNVFKPIPFMEMGEADKKPDFICLYVDEPSSKLAIDNAAYKDDSFMLNGGSESWPEAIKSKSDDNGYTIPAFGVSQGRQYQSYFTSVNVSMESPMVTEQSLKAMFLIAGENDEKRGENGRDAVFIGQDLYTVYSNNSYTCTVTMMGCAWIQPLMYFVLLNVPLFRGTYMIKSVTHNIVPGSMTTTFVGVRMSRYSTPKANRWIQGKANDENGASMSIVGSAVERLASLENDCEYKVFPVYTSVSGGSPKFNIDDLRKETTKYGNVLSVICGTVINEAGNQGPIGKKLVVLSMINRYMLKGSWDAVLKKGQYAIGTSATEDSDVIDILENGPEVLVGKTTDFVNYEGKEVPIWVNNSKTSQKASAHTITKEDVQKIQSFCTAWMYAPNEKITKPEFEKNAVFFRSAEFILQHRGHVFTGADRGAAKKCWDYQDTSSVTDSQDISTLAKGVVDALQKTCDATESVKTTVEVTNVSNNGDTVTIKVKDTDKSAYVFDILLNGYYKYVQNLYWGVNDSGRIGLENPDSIILTVTSDTSPNRNIDVYCMDTNSVPMGSANIYSDSFYKCIKKRYKDDWNTCQKEVKSFTNDVYDDVQARLSSNDVKLVSCSQVKSEFASSNTSVPNADGDGMNMDLVGVAIKLGKDGVVQVPVPHDDTDDTNTDLVRLAINLGERSVRMPSGVKLTGIRSTKNTNGQQTSNKFIDVCLIEYGNTFKVVPFTTVPGLKSMKNFDNGKGVAILEPGKYTVWTTGLHKGQYRALVQREGEVEVYRDGNRDNVFNFGPIDKGFFGINCHKAGADSTFVDNWSAGCQVFKRKADFDFVMSLIGDGESVEYELITEQEARNRI